MVNHKYLLDICLELYKTLSVGCKPKSNEWNVLAGIVQRNKTNNKDYNFKCVSLASGTKCIGHDKYCSNGFIINDSHAEVLVRRSFLRYLYDQLELATGDEFDKRDLSIFYWKKSKGLFALKKGISFHFVCTRIPCGDACIHHATKSSGSSPTESIIFTGAKVIEGRGDISNIKKQIGKKRNNTNDSCTVPLKKKITEQDENKLMLSDNNNKEIVNKSDKVELWMKENNIGLYAGTENTCLNIRKMKLFKKQDQDQDFLRQIVGVERTKPGRGVSTLSMSCSDKLAKWQLMGLQGALLSTLIAKPIYVKSLTFCDRKPDERKEEALKRAIWKRYVDSQYSSSKYKLHVPKIKVIECTMDIGDSITPNNKPSSVSFVWTELHDILQKNLDFCVNGWKLGANKKIYYTSSASIKVSRYHLLQLYVNLLKRMRYIQEGLQIESIETLESMKYSNIKLLAYKYQRAWLKCKTSYFKCWTKKPEEYMNFSLENTF